MRRLSEIIVSTLGKIRSLMAESSHTNYSSEISAMNNITVSHVFDSLMGDSSPGYRVSILRQWIGDIVPSEIPKTSSHSYAAMRTSIYFGITEVQRAISELSLLEEIRSGGATGDRARGSLGAPAPLPGFFRGAGALINSSLAQPTVLISPTWALRTSNATEGAVPGASGDRLFPVETIRMERLYEEELAQLAEMGFYDVEANIQALQMARGVVEDAIELLFEHFPRNMD